MHAFVVYVYVYILCMCMYVCMHDYICPNTEFMHQCRSHRMIHHTLIESVQNQLVQVTLMFIRLLQPYTTEGVKLLMCPYCCPLVTSLPPIMPA